MNSHFLDMKMSWSPEGDLQFGVFRKKGQQLKYAVKDSTHTPGTLCEYGGGKPTPSIHRKNMDKRSEFPDP